MGGDQEFPGGRDANTSFTLRTRGLITKYICATLADVDDLIRDAEDESENADTTGRRPLQLTGIPIIKKEMSEYVRKCQVKTAPSPLPNNTFHYLFPPIVRQILRGSRSVSRQSRNHLVLEECNRSLPLLSRLPLVAHCQEDAEAADAVIELL